jgi:hypothetical protein
VWSVDKRRGENAIREKEKKRRRRAETLEEQQQAK